MWLLIWTHWITHSQSIHLKFNVSIIHVPDIPISIYFLNLSNRQWWWVPQWLCQEEYQWMWNSGLRRKCLNLTAWSQFSICWRIFFKVMEFWGKKLPLLFWVGLIPVSGSLSMLSLTISRYCWKIIDCRIWLGQNSSISFKGLKFYNLKFVIYLL